MRNKIFYLATLFLAGCIATGCTDEQRGNIGTPAQAGEPVRFSVDAPQSRTDYVGQEGDKWILKWMTDDEIGICTTADIVTKFSTTGDNEKKAVYTVLPIDEPGPHQYHGDLRYHEENHLIWKEGATDAELNTTLCTFYGAYPASRITGYPIDLENRYFEMAYYTNQTVKIDNPTDNSGVYTTSPDMDNAYMIARKNIYPNGDHILLDFDPIMTTLDITVTAGRYEVATGIINPVTVTGVSVIMPSKLQDGKITYDTEEMEAEGVTGKLKEGTWITGHTEPVFVGFDEYTDKNGNQRRSVDLHPGESINLMAFLPPIPMGENSGAKIRVHALGGLNFVMTVTPAMLEQHRIYVQLPDIFPASEVTPEQAALLTNSWISGLDKDIKLNQLSIPGYECKEEDSNELIEKLLAMGVRAFDVNNLRNGSAHLRDLPQDKAQLFKDFIKKERAEGRTGFVILLWNGGSGLGNDFDKADYKLMKDNWNTTTISNLNNQIISLEWHAGDYYSQEGTYSWTNPFANQLPFGATGRDGGFLISNSNWDVQYRDIDKNPDKIIELNKEIYEDIISTSLQDGCTGIVMVPYAGSAYINEDGSRKYTYSDLLIQSIIDCNYKFH